jgi:hypothetical protein
MKIENIDSSKIAEAIIRFADAITPQNSVACTDAAGVNVSSLTEAIMGMTAGLVGISDAIYTLGEVIDNHTTTPENQNK